MKNTQENMIKKVWPAFISKASYAMTISAVYINVIIISNILWHDEPFHSGELGLMIGSSMIMTAISGILFGYLADKFSRKKLYTFSIAFYGFGLLLNGFVPQGLGDVSFYLFFTALLIQAFFSGAFTPTETSYINDIVDQSQRSRFYGSVNVVFQLAQILGMLVSSILFQNLLWRQFYWILGSLIILEGLLVAIKAQEPKRGINQEELKNVLQASDIKYNYQLTRETIRDTVLRRTNVVAFIEGIFTTILLSIPDFLLIAYVTGPPHNVAPFTTTVFILMTGIPGAILGSISFAKLSDHLAKKNIRYRIYMIITSLIGMFAIFLFLFMIPIPNFSLEEGKNITIIFSHPEFVILGILAFLAKMIYTIYFINQPPILQKINLPEAQGKVSSANQFLELIGSGLGPIIAGFLLASLNQNYQSTVLISVTLGMIGGSAWLLGVKSINRDILRISSILNARAEELKENGQLSEEIKLIAQS